MRTIRYALLTILILLQYPLWLGSASVFNLWRLNNQIEAQQVRNRILAERNQALQADVVNLKSGLDAIEERARLELGMTRRGEGFYRVIDPN